MEERQGINLYGIERLGPAHAQREISQYHPRYVRSEWQHYRALERRNNWRACGWLLFVLACAVGIVWMVTR